MKPENIEPVSQPVPDAVLYHGDCVEIMAKMADESVDLIVTDPPYLVNYRDRTGRMVANDDRDDWLKPAYAQMFRTLKKDSFCISFYGWSKVDRFMVAWLKAGFYPVAHLVWAKPYASNSRYVDYHHESAYLLAKGRPEIPKTKVKDVLAWNYSGNRHHPTQKPVSALTPLIKSFSKPSDVILDPFMGSGSTGVAALEIGRSFIGCELEETYASAAKSRLEATKVLAAA